MADETTRPPSKIEHPPVPMLNAAPYLEDALRRLGVLCSECGLPLEGDPPGYEYVRLGVGAVEPSPKAPKGVAVRTERDIICGREECKAERERLDGVATARRVIRSPWEFLSN